MSSGNWRTFCSWRHIDFGSCIEGFSKKNISDIADDYFPGMSYFKCVKMTSHLCHGVSNHPIICSSACSDPPQTKHKYSLLMNRIKIISPAIFLYGMNNTFLCVDVSVFDQSYSGGITATKSLPDIDGTTKMSAAWLPWDSPWSLASTPWAMSLHFKFRAIYFWLLNEYQWWDEAKIYHIIRKLSHRFMCEIMIWSGDKTKLIRKKHFHKTTTTSSKP